jgi:serine/threonine-protein kinase
VACYDRNAACLIRGVAVSTCPSGAHPRDRTVDGIFDLAGDVAEWVSDGFTAPLPGRVDPIGDPSSPLRVVRGASFVDDAEKLRTTWRNAVPPTTADVRYGFRCALDSPADAGAP